MISFALREPRERTPRSAIGLPRQFAGDGFSVQLSRANCFAAPLADARDAEKLKPVVPVRLGISEKRKRTSRERGKPAQVHLIVMEDGDERLGRSAAQVLEVNLRDHGGNHVRAAIPTEDVQLEFRQPHRSDPQAPKISRGMQKIEMSARDRGANGSSHAVARFEQRPVE